MSDKPFFITTAIDYTNGAPHIGHAYEKVLADVIARYHRLAGREVFFLTGVDQHGQKIQQSAEKQNIAPQEFVDGITAKFRALWDKLDVRYDLWAATTEPLHKICVQKILTHLNDAGQIYKDRRGGYYSIRQEQFLTDKDRGPDGEFGECWGQVEFRDEENYYFRLTEHKAWLLDLIDKRTAAGTPLVVPDFRVSELRNAVQKLEGDLCISRPKARLYWGIEFPFDPDFVTYVWFDALVNYISFAGYDPSPSADLTEFRKWWPALHVIGKDILIPAHGVYWPIMLKGLGFSDDEIPPLLVHGWWNISGAKMSKSVGNIIDPVELADKYSVEAVRYYLMSDIATGRDADFSEERLALYRYNTDLANTLGNLLNRSLNMASRYREGKLVRFNDVRLSANTSRQLIFETVSEYKDFLKIQIGDAFQIAEALQVVFGHARTCNLIIESEAPWKLSKQEKDGDQIAGNRLDEILYTLAESLRIIAILISPVLPKAAAGIFAQLNWNGPMTLAEAEWGKLPDGHQLGQPVPLFPRIETPK